MKKTLVLTLIMVLILSAFARAASSKLNLNLEEDCSSFVLTDEGYDNLIDRLEDVGCTNLYQALVYLRNDLKNSSGVPERLTSQMDALIATLGTNGGGEVFTASLHDFTGGNSPVGINEDGTFTRADFSVFSYDGHEGYTRYAATVDTALGRELYTYSNSSNYDIYIGSNDVTLGGGITKTVNYRAFAVGWSSPIVLDLNGDGKLDASGGKWMPHGNFVEGAKSAIFDIDSDGFEDIVEWVSPNDGLLLMPGETANLDGESLFGNNSGYKDGYEKLASYDANKDGKLSGDELKGMNVWIDQNGDGKANAKEIKTLASLHITEISTTHKSYVSSFTQNGQRKYCWDWWPTAMSVEKVAKITQ